MFAKKPEVDLGVAGNTAGWMSYIELEWLARQAQKHQKIVEIGSFMGRSTRALADNTAGVVVAVDDFKGPRDKSLPDFLRQNLLELFLYNVADLAQVGKVITVAADHGEVNVDFSPDMVFLDGSHEYEDVKRDILMWHNRITPGGLLCGHDYTNMDTVRAAVDELVKGPQVAKGTSIWYTVV